MAEFYKNHKEITRLDLTIKFILLILIVVLLPFFLIAIEKTILPYPAFVEEIAKAFVIFFLILNLPRLKHKILAGLLFGSLFGLSENIFYLTNIIESGNISIFWQRTFSTIPMHIITVLIILLPALKNKKLIIFGLVGAIIIHLVFNNLIT